MSAQEERRDFFLTYENMSPRTQDWMNRLDSAAFVVHNEGTEWADGWDSSRFFGALAGEENV